MMELYNVTSRRLQSSTLFNTDVPPFQVSIHPSMETEEGRLEHSWNIVKADSQKGLLELQIDFKEPEYVSSNIDYDKFASSVVDPKFYQNRKGKLDTASKIVEGDIIRQIDANTY